mmetsp:Transcript_47869/g.124247  ORF Transcript_47869/g.124247 Transcript_47869/m.124247 type:complete len:115 (-) Transcript_47869:444-788(-)
MSTSMYFFMSHAHSSHLFTPLAMARVFSSSSSSCFLSFHYFFLIFFHIDSHAYLIFFSKRGVSWDEESIKDFDAVLVVTNHEKASVDVLRNFKGLVVDTRNWVPRDWGLDLVRS